jgi:hypothetical protein
MYYVHADEKTLEFLLSLPHISFYVYYRERCERVRDEVIILFMHTLVHGERSNDDDALVTVHRLHGALGITKLWMMMKL